MPPKDNEPGDEILPTDEIEDLLRFDAFADDKAGGEGEPNVQTPPAEPKPSGEGDPPSAQAGQEEKPAAPEGVAAPAEPEPAPAAEPAPSAEPAPPTEPPAVPELPAPPTPPEPTPEQRELAALRAEVAAMRAQQQQPPAPAAPSEPELPPYDFNIPDGIVDGLAAEEPAQRRAALASLVKGVSQAVHRTIREEMGTTIDERMNGALSAQNQQQATFNDFYGHYPQYNTPQLRQLVALAAAQTVQETGLVTWGPQLRELVAQRVAMLVQPQQVPSPATGLQPTPAPAAVPAPAPAPLQPNSPHIMRGTASPPSTPPKRTEEDDIMDTLMGGY